MKKHKKIYRDFFEMGDDDVPLCEVCDAVAVDIHHIDCRGMGGSHNKDYIGNLMALCRNCHEKYGDKKQYIMFLENIHFKFVSK